MSQPDRGSDPDQVASALAAVTTALPGGGEAREGQVHMAQAVAQAIESGRHLIVQAGTGTGKSLAYLVPAILAGQRVVVATATKALQDQLALKDLPFLREHLGVDFDVAVLKGRSNYLCKQRAAEISGTGDGQLTLDDLPGAELGTFGREIARLLDWGTTSDTGDRSTLPFEPRPPAWAAVSTGAMECPGAQRCPVGDACFAEQARQRAATAQVVVVNTHLYVTHLASGGFVLPEHDIVVFDEAHELEDVAAANLGFELGGGRFTSLARLARPVLPADSAGAADDLLAAGDQVERAAAPWFGQRLPEGLDERLQSALAVAATKLSALTAALRKADHDDDAGARANRALQAAGHLAGDIATLAALSKSFVAWVEGKEHAPILKVAQIDVGAVLSEVLWGEVTAILTSATIPSSLVQRVGLPADNVDLLDVGSPFPYATHALLYCALHLPERNSAAYQEAMHDELRALITCAGGRTLALFTSWRAMTAAADALRSVLDVPIFTQSDLPKPALIEAFSSDESACLFATMGFWQGIDVPGKSLSLVTLDRIPFPRPDDPLLQARRERAGPDAFRLIDLPRAATMLAQGAGRLIRSATDKGVVAVLDPRLGTAGYRWDLVRALPPMPRTRERSKVEQFLAGALAG